MTSLSLFGNSNLLRRIGARLLLLVMVSIMPMALSKVDFPNSLSPFHLFAALLIRFNVTKRFVITLRYSYFACSHLSMAFLVFALPIPASLSYLSKSKVSYRFMGMSISISGRKSFTDSSAFF